MEFYLSISHFAELLIIILFGVLAGIVTGLMPGLHVNLVSAIIIFYSPVLFLSIGLEKLAVFIFVVAITHAIIDFLPTIFLGASDNENNVCHLPGHRFLIKGRARKAVMLCTTGCFFAAILILFLAVPLIKLISFVFGKISGAIGLLLIIISLILILSERTLERKIWAFSIFLISGAVGFLVLNMNINNPLLAMLSGLFGISILIISINSKKNIPTQFEEKFKVDNKKVCVLSLIGIVSSALISLLPALTASHATYIGTSFPNKLKKNDLTASEEEDEKFLILTGSVSMSITLIAVLTTLAISKARNGAVAAMQQLSNFNYSFITILIFSSLIAVGAATIAIICLSNFFSQSIPKINYGNLCLCIIAVLSFVIFYFDGVLGLIVLITTTAIGILTSLSQIKRNTAMACLIVPVILYLL